MPKLKTLTLAMSAVSMMAGCASTQAPVGENGMNVKAVQAVSHGSSSPQAFYQLGRYYHGQTRYEKALEAYGQALSLQPQYVDALTGIGVAHAMLGHYDEALRVLKAAASIDPASVTAQNNLGYIYWLLNEREKATEAYRAALKLDPKNARAGDNLRVAMDDATNAAAPGGPEQLPTAVAAVAAADPTAEALQRVAPQVYELRAAISATPAHGERAQGAAVYPAAAPDGAGLALNEVSPQVYELRAQAQQADHTVPRPEPARAAPVEQKIVVAAGGSDSAPPAAVAYLEVMNGNGVKGLATNVTRYLAAKGYPTLGAGNQPQFNEARTRIEYRPGHAEAAGSLGAMLPGRVVLSELAAMDGHASIRLVLGKDFRRAPANWLAGRAPRPAGPIASPTPLAVANGNGVKGMARRMADYLAGRGFQTASVYDLRPFNKAVTRIEYRTGHAADATRIGDQLPGKVAYVELPGLHAQVRLVLGHDVKRTLAAWSPGLESVKLAHADAAGAR
jgi:tetratricopeptide (TPR) repeat protein